MLNVKFPFKEEPRKDNTPKIGKTVQHFVLIGYFPNPDHPTKPEILAGIEIREHGNTIQAIFYGTTEGEYRCAGYGYCKTDAAATEAAKVAGIEFENTAHFRPDVILNAIGREFEKIGAACQVFQF